MGAPDGNGGLAAPGVPAVDFSAELPSIDFVPAPVSAEKAVIPAATTTHYVMNCRTRLLHKPAADEAETERAEWQARCGWPYGVRQFYRLHDLPPNPSPVLSRYAGRPGGAGSRLIVRQLLLHERRDLGVRLIVAGNGQPNIPPGRRQTILVDTDTAAAPSPSPRGPEKSTDAGAILSYLFRSRCGSRPPTLFLSACRLKLSDLFFQPWPPHRRWLRRWWR